LKEDFLPPPVAIWNEEPSVTGGRQILIKDITMCERSKESVESVNRATVEPLNRIARFDDATVQRFNDSTIERLND
jgi:hypothetical protein